MNEQGPPVDYDLTCWYLNARLVIELLGADNLIREIGPIDTFSEIHGLAKTVVPPVMWLEFGVAQSPAFRE
jgi:hypothetical protein